jgi:glycosyltransferase involved in cell wall biosynthesis
MTIIGMKKVSVITVNLNNASGLEKTITSIANQTAKDFEFIVIDGGSTDNSIDIIKKHSDKINYWVSEPDNGIYNAMNKGIMRAKGEYVIFINSEDELNSDTILAQFSAANTCEDIVCGDINYIQSGISVNSKSPETAGFLFFMVNTLPHQASFIKRRLFDTVGYYDEALKIASDWKFFLLALCKYRCSYKKINYTVAKHPLTGISASEKGKVVFVNEKKQALLECFGMNSEDGVIIEKSYHLYEDVHRSRLIKLLRNCGFLSKIRM